jgi:uncharacterized secreted protein with C-terminal beta-propeller domain
MVVGFALAVAPGCAKAKAYKPGDLKVGNELSCAASDFQGARGEIPRLQLVSTCSRFAGYLVASLSATGFNGGMRSGDSAGAVATGLAEDAGASPASYSKTNVQEAGVDEPDLVKTDGNYLYLVSGTDLVILKSWPPTALATVAKVPIADWPQALLLEGDRVAVLSQRTPQGADEKGATGSPAQTRPFTPTTRVTLVNVSDRAKPAVERTVDLEMWYQDARLIRGRLVVVGESSLPLPSLDTEPSGEVSVGTPGSVDGGTPTVVAAAADADRRALLGAAVARTRFEQWIPSLDDSLAPGRRLVVKDFGDLYMPTVVGSTGILALVSLDLTHPGAELKSTALVSSGGLVYASSDSLFVSYTSGQWLWLGAPDGVVSSDMGWSRQATSIQKFAFNSIGVPNYAGAATVPGWVGNAYQMSEYQGYLRVVSSAGPQNALTVLGPTESGDLTAVGSVASFAPDESVMGARFLGDRAYVSTYHWVWMRDPFFTFDLADPRHPKLVGALEMPGYSAYLQPLDGEHVLALGMFAATMGDPVTSVQVQVFDVSDFAHPVTSDQFVIDTGDGRSFSEALGSTHAMTWYPEEKIFAFPVSVWSGDWTSAFNGLVAFRIDAAAGIVKLGQIDHRTFDPSGADWYATDVRRGVFMTGGDGATYAYTISNIGVAVNATSDWSRILGRETLPFNTQVAYGFPGDVRAMGR